MTGSAEVDVAEPGPYPPPRSGIRNLPSSARSSIQQRPKLWTEAFFVGWLLWLYDDINNLTPLRNSIAVRHATSVLDLEKTIHVDPERALNTLLAAHHLLAVVAANYYNNAHFVVTLGVIGYLWARRPDLYRPHRNVLVWINLIGFAVFWAWPMAPPRMLPGYIDTVAQSSAVGSFHTGTLAAQANQLAAMPSLHVAWAVWSALGVWRVTRRRALRAVAAVYPAVTISAVLATANHLLIDSVAGLVTAAMAIPIGRRGDEIASRIWPRRWLTCRTVTVAIRAGLVAMSHTARLDLRRRRPGPGAPSVAAADRDLQ